MKPSRFQAIKYLNDMNGTMTTTLTNTLDNAVVKLMNCPYCKSITGRKCRTSTGAVAPTVHTGREEAAVAWASLQLEAAKPI